MDKLTFLDALDNLINTIDSMAIELMKNEMEKYNEHITNLSELLEICFPVIIESYSDPLLSKVSSDREYWTGQLGRIVDALNGKDKFVKLDVLYHETEKNLIAYRDMIMDTSIAQIIV